MEVLQSDGITTDTIIINLTWWLRSSTAISIIQRHGWLDARHWICKMFIHFRHNSIYIYFRTCVSTYIHLKVYERFMDFSTPLDQDLATKSLNTSQSHQCLRMFRWEISLAKLSSKAPWRGDFFSICTLAHVCCFLQKVDHHIATRWVDLLWSVAVDLHRWRRCQYLAPWYPAIQHVFFF